ncbi:MAG: tRNA dihydrouridine synthase DusB [Firmicutes bacterium]|nr:tRNA dihydrouridine synthase DusB [Bacillota bacterium]
MRLGSIETENNVFLAPMAGITDAVYRLICKEMGTGLVYSEMVSAKGMSHNNKKTKDMLFVDKRERPAVIQLFGSEPDIMAQAVKTLEEYPDIDIIDINMGCPAPKIVKNGEGSALSLNPELAARVVYAVANNSSKPVTVKFRKGFDDEHISAVEMAKLCEENGAAAVTLHGRTREQYYSGKADWDIIKEAKAALKKIPLVGNGDIFTPEDAKRMLEYTGCDAVMIGRGAQGNPWIFKRTVHYLETGELLPEPTYEQRISMARRHLKMLVEYKGENIGVCEMRKHIGWYLKGLPHSAEMRVKVNSTKGLENMDKLLAELGEMLKGVQL